MTALTKPAFMLAAPRSNSGKTLVTLGLIKALCRRGLKVQPFKCGADYIDPLHHKAVSGRPSYNLDTWMSPDDHVQNLFFRYITDADVGIVEGVMGLFDGALKDKGSPAEIARLLSIPVVLVVEASSTAYSVAPLLYGFKNFDPRIKLAGVIFNKTASSSHVNTLREAAKDAGVEMLGYIPRNPGLTIESRHLGLHLPGENKNNDPLNLAADFAGQHVNIDRLLEICRVKYIPTGKEKVVADRKITVAMACDEAFCFTYQANLDALQELGDVKFFSPIHDSVIPEADCVWLPGGYPELFSDKLSENKAMMNSIKAHVEAGRPLVAECGGMMYLGREIKNGKANAMAGIFNFSTSFSNMKLHLGYRQIDMDSFSLRGHEFHYSALVDNKEVNNVGAATTARGLPADMQVFRYKNCWASYLHLYLGEPQKMLKLLKFLNVRHITGV